MVDLLNKHEDNNFERVTDAREMIDLCVKAAGEWHNQTGCPDLCSFCGKTTCGYLHHHNYLFGHCAHDCFECIQEANRTMPRGTVSDSADSSVIQVGRRGLKGQIPEGKWIPPAARKIIEDHVDHVMLQLGETVKIKREQDKNTRHS